MSKPKKSRRRLHRSVFSSARTAKPALLTDPALISNKYLELFIALSLLAFGIFHSVKFWAYAPMPHPDSPYFIRVGHELLALDVPSSFKRAPVVGLLQALLSYLVGGRHPDLTAGWLLNSLLHPLNALLLWLVGRKIIGKAADFLAVILILNPWVFLRLTETIAETTLMFFTLLTFYFIFRRSNWCYLFAALASMVRYEGAALIVAAFVTDMIMSDNARLRWRALARSALAMIPLLLWLLGTHLTYREGAGHYFGHYLGGKNYDLLKYLTLIWQTSVMPLFEFAPKLGSSPSVVFWGISKVITFVVFMFGGVYALLKRRWDVLALLTFFILYFIVHAGRTSAKERYYAPLFWIVVMVCCLGLRGLWRIVAHKFQFSRRAIYALQVVVLLVSLVWTGILVSYLPDYCPAVSFLPWLALFVLAVIYFARLYVHGVSRFMGDLALLAVVFLTVVSNQFVLAERMAMKGVHDIEFKLMVDWYRQNAQPGEKLLTSLPAPVRMMVSPEEMDSFQHTAYVDSADPVAFTRDCLRQGVVYVTWDSRIGTATRNSYYKRWHIEKIRMLIEPRSLMLMESDPLRPGRPRPVAYYKFLTGVGNRYRHINIFRLYEPADAPERPVRYCFYDKAKDTLTFRSVAP